MKISEDGILLRIFVGESDRVGTMPLYEDIVIKAREFGLAGATVFRGIMGFGGNSRFHSLKLLALSEDLPIIIEIVDSEEKVEEFMSYLDKVVKEGLITKEKVSVLRYTE